MSDRQTELHASPAVRNNDITFEALADRVGRETAEIIWRHLAPEIVADDPAKATCFRIAEARRRFSSKAVARGLHFFAADRGKSLEAPAAMMSLSTLVQMLTEARERRSLVEALAASEDLPAAETLAIDTGRRGMLLPLEEEEPRHASDTAG